MKFSQFVELDEKLQENGYSIQDLKDGKAVMLSEGNVFKYVGQKMAGLGLLGKSRKLKRYFGKTLSKLEKEVKAKLQKHIKEIQAIKNKRIGELKNIEKAGKPVPQQAKKALMQLEMKMLKIIDQLVDKFSELKTTEVMERLDKANIKDKTRAKLMIEWESLLTDFKIGLLKELYEQKILQTDQTIKFTKKLEAGKKKADDSGSSDSDSSEDSGGEGEAKGGEL